MNIGIPTSLQAQIDAVTKMLAPTASLRGRLEALESFRGARETLAQTDYLREHLAFVKVQENSYASQIASQINAMTSASAGAIEQFSGAAVWREAERVLSKNSHAEKYTEAANHLAIINAQERSYASQLASQIDSMTSASAKAAEMLAGNFVQHEAKRVRDLNAVTAQYLEDSTRSTIGQMAKLGHPYEDWSKGIASAVKSLGLSASLVATDEIERMLAPSTALSKYVEQLVGSRAMQTALAQATRLHTPYEEFSNALSRFTEPLGVVSVFELAESISHAAKTAGLAQYSSNFFDADPPEDVRQRTMGVLQNVTADVERAASIQEALSHIVAVIGATKEPFLQKALFTCLIPFLFVLLGAIINPIADFHIKKLLEASSKPESAKAVKESAQEAVGDLRLLSDYRFVSGKQISVFSTPRARSSVIGQLQFGQPVRVLEKGQDFTLIRWASEDGEAEVRGWVFSRYLKRFQ